MTVCGLPLKGKKVYFYLARKDTLNQN